MARILIVDDERSVRITLMEFLKDIGHEVFAVENVDQALSIIKGEEIDIVVTDIILPRINGIKLLKMIHEYSPDIHVIIITGEPTVETATDAIKAGAFDYLPKPVSKSAIEKSVGTATRIKFLSDEKRRLEKENKRYQEHLEDLVNQRTRALKKSEKKYRTLTDNLNVGIFRSTPGSNSKFIEVNPAILSLFSYKDKKEILKVELGHLFENKKEFEILNAKIFRDGYIKSEEVQLQRRDGTIIFGSISAVAVKNDKGKVKYYDGIIDDITDRVKMEEKVRRFASVIQDSSDAIILYNFEGEIIAWDKTAAIMYGWSEEEALKLNIRNMVPEEKHYEIKELIDKSAKGIVIEPYETVRLNKAGQLIYIWLTITTLKDEDGVPYAFAGTECNITERKGAQEALKETEEKYSTVLANSPDPIVVYDNGGKAIYLNSAFARVFGWSQEELLGKNLDYIPEENWPETHDIIDRINRGESLSGIETRRFTKSGEILDVSISISSYHDRYGNPSGSIHILRDITEQKRAEQELKAAQDYARNLVDSSLDMIISVDKNRKIVEFNKAAETTFGYSKEDVIGKPVDILYSEAETGIRMNQTCRDKGRFYGEVENQRQDGEIFPSFISASIIRDSEEKLIGVMGVSRDITEQKRIEQDLRDSEERYRSLIDALGEGVIVADLNDKVSIANPAAEKIFGVKENELINHTLDEFLDDKNREIIRNQTDARIRGETSSYPVEIIQQGGNKRLLNITATPRYDKNSNLIGALGIFRDITDLKRMEEELQKIEKLESISLLAGGIAHDFNNILTIVLGNLTLAKMLSETDEKTLSRIQNAEKAALRARDLTQQLLTFSKGGAPVKTAASISELLKESASFSVTGSTIKCELSIPDNLYTLEIDEGQISQVINNLIINAQHAMPDGGLLQVKAENIDLEESNSYAIKPGHYVKITIKDQGIGIPEEHLQKIFDPFFTTKKKGTGLGLSTSFSIIKKHEGIISVKSEVGTGTKFNILLPAAESTILKEKIISNTTHAGEGKILVMDDEEDILDITKMMLSKIGYSTEFSKDGSEAVEVYQNAMRSGRPFDLVIVDLTVPGGMGGKEALGKITEIDPKAKVILSSGYYNNPIVAHYKEHGFIGVITKPYQLDKLSSTISDALKV